MNSQSENLTHRSLAVSCFNRAWEYLRKPELGAEEAEEMIQGIGDSHLPYLRT